MNICRLCGYYKNTKLLFLGDAIDKMEELVQNKLPDLDEIATNLEFGEDDEEDSPKRKQLSTESQPKKRKNNPADNTKASEDELDTQDLEDQMDSETTESEVEYDYDY